MVRTDSTAILIFTRTTAAEAAAKPLAGRSGQRVNRELAESLIVHTHREAEKTGLPVFTSFSTQQVGSHFGERLVNAFQSVFDKGFTQVISIGNDCPNLESATILKAADSLKKQSLVLGPATDGGLYLLGMTQVAFHQTSITDLPWETSQLQGGISKWALDRSWSIEWLAVESDIDTPEELKRYLFQDRGNHGIIRVLKRILSGTLQSDPTRSLFIPSTFIIGPFSRRGPPR